MSKQKDIINHRTGKAVAKTAQKTLREAYQARLGARKMARSGNPAKRAEGVQGVFDTTEFIHSIYHRDTAGLLK